ncbi:MULTISPECIES: hypothetical protein [Bacillus]|uniref:hypothetical protein n=1 Tax=Bacillus TaxID=1386 RepID=UPI00061757AE|nr:MULTISPECIES: hypothetical protein [Bacillus]KKB75671.1 hypothetical protein TH62_00515 [Bacillus sp. TH008]NWN81290.1 hypothetical protein [Bacillus sp. (in: firmicutes)]WPP39255.1 hypothetical protein SK061_24845 [Bacillus sonorensis]
MKNIAPLAFQIIGIIGFVLAFAQISIGWFIGFFCTGLYFIIKRDDEPKKFTLLVGILAFLYSFYCLFTQTNIF